MSDRRTKAQLLAELNAEQAKIARLRAMCEPDQNHFGILVGIKILRVLDGKR